MPMVTILCVFNKIIIPKLFIKNDDTNFKKCKILCDIVLLENHDDNSVYFVYIISTLQ